MSKHRCHTCGAKVSASTCGAAIYGKTIKMWCLPCWDNDPIALASYRVLGTQAP